MSEDHEVVEEEDDLALEEVPERLAPLLLLPRHRLPAAAEPVRRVQLGRGERHAVHQLRAPARARLLLSGSGGGRRARGHRRGRLRLRQHPRGRQGVQGRPRRGGGGCER